MKIAVLFPGIGYTCDKPLLYYSGKLAARRGYEVRPVPYGRFPAGVKGSEEKMQRSFETALAQAEDLLADVDWAAYKDIVFLSKSIGTVVCAAYARRHGLAVRTVAYTPLPQTFLFTAGPAVMFHGTADPWAQSAVIRRNCAERGIPLYITENANHSLETGDVQADLAALALVLRQTDAFLGQA